MDAFHGPSGRRALDSEISDWIAQVLNATLVPGFSEIIDAGGAIAGGERTASFMEMPPHPEWYLPLTAGAPLMWKTTTVPAATLGKVSFLLAMGFGNGSPLPQPSGRWDVYVNDRFAVSTRVVKHSVVWEGDDCSLTFAANRIEAAPPFGSLCLSSVATAESFATFGPALLTVPSDWLTPGTPAVVRLEPRGEARSTRWVQLVGFQNIARSTDIYRLVELLQSRQPPRSSDYNVFFGDIHTHSGQVFAECNNRGCGMGSREENYRYARGPGALDFYALTDHEFQIDPDKAREYLELADEHNEEGRFVCLPAYEFTNVLYGHRNVYFRDSGGTVIDATQGGGFPTWDPAKIVTPAQLWSALEQTGVPFLTVPHHPSATSHPFTWEFFDPRYDRLVEIYSCWGSSEYYGDTPRGVSDRYRTLDVRAALDHGYRVGFIASADGHDGHPGDAQSPLVKHHHLFHHLGSGLAAVLTNGLTRHEVFDALYHRRCYATTGVPIVLSFQINGQVMGSELPLPSAPVKLSVNCRGTNGIDHIRIVRNGKVVQTIPGHGEHVCEQEWEEQTPEAPCCYYVRVVQVDGESAWSSPIWIG